MAHGEHDADASQAAKSFRANDSARMSSRAAHSALPFKPATASVAEPVVLQSSHQNARGAGPHNGFDIRIRVPHPTAVIADAIDWSQNRIATREERPWLALIAVPLALTAVLDTVAGYLADASTMLWGVPLIGAAWWWSPRVVFRWTWLLPLEAAGFTVAWSMAGASSLASWPRSQLLVGLVWAGSAAVIAVVAFLEHGRRRR